MTVYYNDHDPQACAWLRELIRGGHIPDGEVDERSILDVQAVDLQGFTSCHFFAGIAGWAYALRLAGWPDDRPVWTGSPPCQPFSVAGRGLARDDARHLAPHFLKLVRACLPDVLFGEQVASASVVGRSGKPPRGSVAGAHEWAWLDDLSDGLEAARYAVGAADIPAAGVGAPHIRQRLFFGAVRVVESAGSGPQGRGRGEEPPARYQPAGASPDHGLADGDRAGLEGHAGHVGDGHQLGWVDADAARPVAARGGACGLADTDDGQQGMVGRGDAGFRRGAQGNARPRLECGGETARPSPLDGFWRDADWLGCRDGKWRPVEPGTFPLADGLPARVGRLRGYGNAICPQAAATFIAAFLDAAR